MCKSVYPSVFILQLLVGDGRLESRLASGQSNIQLPLVVAFTDFHAVDILCGFVNLFVWICLIPNPPPLLSWN